MCCKIALQVVFIVNKPYNLPPCRSKTEYDRIRISQKSLLSLRQINQYDQIPNRRN